MNGSRCEIAADTSFLINLFATQLAVELLDIERLLLLVPTAVYREVKLNRADLDSLVANGRARIVELSSNAIQHYVEAAVVVDDGEAATIALSIAMQIGIATDDGCAAQYWGQVIGVDSKRILGICELLQASEPKLHLEQLREALIRMRRVANFAPPRVHADWWKRALNATEQG